MGAVAPQEWMRWTLSANPLAMPFLDGFDAITRTSGWIAAVDAAGQ
ncbi:MAG TPA: hypothetical protein VGF88_20625 [Acidobacteriaceae bacterium]